MDLKKIPHSTAFGAPHVWWHRVRRAWSEDWFEFSRRRFSSTWLHPFRCILYCCHWHEVRFEQLPKEILPANYAILVKARKIQMDGSQISLLTAHCHKGNVQIGFYKCGLVWIFYSPKINEILIACLSDKLPACVLQDIISTILTQPWYATESQQSASKYWPQPSVHWHSPSWMHAHLIAKLIYGQPQLYTTFTGSQVMILAYTYLLQAWPATYSAWALSIWLPTVRLSLQVRPQHGAPQNLPL